MIKTLFLLILLVPASLLLAAAPAQSSTSVFVSGPDGVSKPMELKKDEDFELTRDNVVSTPLNGKITIFADVGLEFTEAKLTAAHNGQTFDIPIVGGQISFQGLYSDVYTLDVSIGDNVYECIVVIGDQNPQQSITNQITEINNDNDNDNDNDDEPDLDKEEICRYTPQHEICAPDPETGQCDEDFNMNEDGQCFPDKPCPSGYTRPNDDETGACVSEDDLDQCNDGSWKYPDDSCYGEDPTPTPTPTLPPPIEEETVAQIEQEEEQEQGEAKGNSTESEDGQ